MKRTFDTQTEFDTWHDTAKTTLGLPRVGRNALSGEPQPDKQQTTAWTSLGPAEVDDEGNVIDATLVAEVAPEGEAHRNDVATLVRADMLTTAELAALADVFPAWAADEAVSVGELRSFNGKLYKCLQAHTTQSDWAPPVVPALWADTAPPDVIPEWVQPTGAHDAYQIGDRVTFQGKVYESRINANVWSPTAYPAGWQLIP